MLTKGHNCHTLLPLPASVDNFERAPNNAVMRHRLQQARSPAALAYAMLAFAFTALCGPICAAHGQTVAIAGEHQCPAGMPAATRCVRGTDTHGAIYSLAFPAHWNRDLIVYAHGGPTLLPPTSGPVRPLGYASNATVPLLTLGYAIATTTNRDGFFDSPAYAADLVAARDAFIHSFGTPRHTVLYGTSYGGHVALMAGELYPHAWDGIVAEASDVAGELARFYQALDLRVVYQYFCNNLPRPSETQYPLWLGIESGAGDWNSATFDSTANFIEKRVGECTGVDVVDGNRSASQRRALRNVLAFARTTESDLPRAVAGASMTLAMFAKHETGGRNAFTNRQARYAGSDDDVALNAGVARYDADSAAQEVARRLAPTGTMTIPVITFHPVNDRVNVEAESMLAEVYRRARNSERLAQFFNDGTGHLVGPNDHAHRVRMSVAAIQLMFDWAGTGKRPNFEALRRACDALPATSADDTCSGLLPDYQPKPIWTVIPREGRERIMLPPSAPPRR